MKNVHKLQPGSLGLLNFAANESCEEVQEALADLEVSDDFFDEHCKHWERYAEILQDVAFVLENRLIVDIESEMIK